MRFKISILFIALFLFTTHVWGQNITISSLSGVSNTTQVAGATNVAILGIQVVKAAGGTSSFSGIRVQLSEDPTGLFTNPRLVRTNNNSIFDPDDLSNVVTAGTIGTSPNELIFDTSPGAITPFGNSTNAQTREFFIVVDIVSSASTTTIDATVEDTDITAASAVSGAAAGSTFTIEARTTTIGSLNVVATNGVAASPLVAEATNQPVFGFSLTSNATQTISEIRIQADHENKVHTFSLVRSSDEDFSTTGNNTTVGGLTFDTSSPTEIVITGLSENITTTAKHYFLVADIDASVDGSTSFQATLSASHITVNEGEVAGSASSLNYSFEELTGTISQETGGVSNSLIAFDESKALIGFSFTANGPFTITDAVFTLSAAASTIGLENLQLVESATATYDGSGTVIASTGLANLSETAGVITITGITATTSKYYFLAADVSGSAPAGTFGVSLTSLTPASGVISGIPFSHNGISITGLSNTLTAITTAPVLTSGTTITSGSETQVLGGFSISSNGSPTVSAINFSVTNSGNIETFYLRRVDNVSGTLTGATTLGSSASNSNFTISDVIPTGHVYYYYLVADISGTASGSSAVTISQASVTVNGTSSSYSLNQNYNFSPAATSTIAGAGGEFNNIGYAEYTKQTAAGPGAVTNLTTANSTRIFRLTVTDDDTDGFPTVINELHFSLTASGNVRAMGLFDGTTAIADVPVTGSSISFTGLNVSVGPDASKTIDIRVTFNSPITDNAQMVLTLDNVVAATGATVSGLQAYTAGSIVSSGSAGANTIRVTATRLVFVNPASLPPANPIYTGTINATLAPQPGSTFNVTVAAVDEAYNIDYNSTTAVTITTSPAISPSSDFTGGSGSLTAGMRTFNLSIAQIGTYSLGATGGGLTAASSGQNTSCTVVIESVGVDVTKANLSACRVGSASIFNTLSGIVLEEVAESDFSAGNNLTFLVILPNGWEFLTPTTTPTPTTPTYSPPTITFTAGRNITSAAFEGFSGNNIAKFRYSVSGTNQLDALTIGNLSVKNSSATVNGEILRSGTGVIAGCDEQESLGTLTVQPGLPVDFVVEPTPGGDQVSEGDLQFSISSSPVILTGTRGGTKITNIAEYTFSGYGVSYKNFGSPLGYRYTFTPASVGAATVDVTITATNPTNGCLSSTTKQLRVFNLTIQGIDPQMCRNDQDEYPMSVESIDIPAGQTLYDFVYIDENFRRPAATLSLNNNPNPALSDVKFYSGGVPVGLTLTTKTLTNITINPYGTATVYDFYCYSNCGTSTDPLPDPPANYYFFATTSYVQLTIPNHGFAVNDRIFINGYLDYTYPYSSYTEFTVWDVLDANNIVINLGESYGYPVNFDYGIADFYLYTNAPYNITIEKRQLFDHIIDLRVPGHDLINGDRIILQGFTGFEPLIDNKTFSVTVLDANTVRIDTREEFSNSVISGAWNNQTFQISPDPAIKFPGYHFDPSRPFPFRDLTRPRSTGSSNEFIPSSFSLDWESSAVTVNYRTLPTGCGGVVGPGCKIATGTPVRVELLAPPSVDFTLSGGGDLAPNYCVNSSPIMLESRFQDAGTYTAFPGAGLLNIGSGNATFNPADAGITVEAPITIEYSYTDANGCTNTISKQTTIHALPVVDAGPDKEICNGTSVDIGGAPTATNNAAQPSFNFSWTPAASLNGTEIASNPKAAPTSNTTYTVVVVDNFGCSNQDVVVVTVDTPPTVNAGPADAVMCAGTQFSFDDLKTAGANYGGAATGATWSILSMGSAGQIVDENGNLTTDFDIADRFIPSTVDEDNGRVILQLQTNNDPSSSCPPAADQIMIIIHPIPAAPYVRDTDIRYCVGDAMDDLFASGSYNFIRWYDQVPVSPSSLRRTGSNFPTGINTNVDDVYTFYVTDTGNNSGTFAGCESAPTTVTVTVNPRPVVSFSAENFCFEDGMQFNSEDSEVIYSNGLTGNTGTIERWSWEFAPGFQLPEGTGNITAGTHGGRTTGTYQNPNHVFTSIGTFNVKLTAYSSDHRLGTASNVGIGCSNTETIQVEVGPVPKTDFTYNFICENESTQFTGSASNVTAAEISSYDWTFGDGATESLTTASTSHAYGVRGLYSVELTITTALGCTGTATKEIPILPYITSFPYVADFQSDAGWQPQAMVFEPQNQGLHSWNLVAPGNTFGDVKEQQPGDKFWITRADGTGTYYNSERSVLNGPCLNLSGVPRPLLSFDYWNSTDSRSDGAYLEVSTDGGLSWNRLGVVGEGIEWYDQSAITGLTTASGIGQGVGQFGWSGKTHGWKTAKISLDDYVGETNLRVRYVFGSNSESRLDDIYDGFALDDFAIKTRNRTILVENFTNSFEFNNNQNFYDFKESLTNSEVVKLQYHTGLKSPSDAIYPQNNADVDARAAFYGLTNENTVPRVFLDGQSQGSFATSNAWGEQEFTKRTLFDAPFEIVVDTKPDTGGNLRIAVDVKAEGSVPDDGRIPVLYVAVLEKNVGSDEFVMRKILPNAAGYRIPLPLADQQQVTFPNDFVWTITNENIDLSNLAIVAFIQDLKTKMVDQAAVNWNPNAAHLPTIITGTEPSLASQIKLYPNPANETVQLKLPGVVHEAVPFTVFDSFGKSVYTSVFKAGEDTKTVVTENLRAGMYFIQLETKKGLVRKKLMVVHD